VNGEKGYFIPFFDAKHFELLATIPSRYSVFCIKKNTHKFGNRQIFLLEFKHMQKP
jgi:hypothetical protein